MSASNFSKFREAERKYKGRNKGPLDLSEVYDFQNIENLSTDLCDNLIRPITKVSIFENNLESHVYQFKSLPGVTFISNPFSEEMQRELIEMTVTGFTDNPTSLDAHYLVSKPLFDYIINDQILEPKVADDDLEINPYDGEKMPPQIPLKGSKILEKLRWVNLGMKYNWYTKTYETSKEVKKVPPVLVSVSRKILSSISPILRIIPGAIGGGSDMEGENADIYCSRRQSYKSTGSIVIANPTEKRAPEVIAICGYTQEYFPEAGIVNFYGKKDSLTGHVDRAEVNMEAPLVSLSFGASCIFLIGGSSVDKKPEALLLRSGDVLILSGEARRSFHGVPRIIEGSVPEYLTNNNKDKKGIICSEYLKTGSRININVRQVYFHNSS